MAVESPCLFNKFGHCKFRDTCRHRHIQDICENINCEITTCEKRHPSECRFWNAYRRCKFGDYCSYKHKSGALSKENESLKNELEIVKTKLDKLEKILSAKKQEISEILIRIENLKINEANNLEHFKRHVIEKEPESHETDAIYENLVSQILKATTESIEDATVSAIAPFAARQSDFELKTEAQFDAIETQLGSLLAILSQKSSQTKPPTKYTCNMCGNTFDTERALKNHVRTHQIT